MATTLFQCTDCKKTYEKLELAEMCESAHSFTKKEMLKKEDSVNVKVLKNRDTDRKDCLSILESPVTVALRKNTENGCDGNWHQRGEDAHGWRSGSTPSFD